VQRSKLRHAQAIERLKRGDRVDVKIQPLCIFLLRDGTVISLSRGRSLAFTTPIRDRLRHAETGLRESADAAMLVQALLDLLVDRVFEVIDAYHTRILALEHAVLLRPRMKHVSALHIIQADLNQIRRTLEPVKTVAYGLRRCVDGRFTHQVGAMTLPQI
jgi:Mg2+ and Co2+ transporter CorA